MKLVTTARFNREFIALLKSHRLLENKTNKILRALATNPRDPSLHLHKLTGTNNYSISVDRNIRIILNWEDNQMYLSRIGTHDEVY